MDLCVYVGMVDAETSFSARNSPMQYSLKLKDYEQLKVEKEVSA